MTEPVSSPRMRTAVYHLSRAFLENDRFSLSALPPSVTRHFPYSRAFIASLEDPRFLENPGFSESYYLDALGSRIKEPTGLTPFTAKLVEKVLVAGRISEAMNSYTEKTPISSRIPSFNLAYHPTVGFDASCALFARLCQSKQYPWELINVCEVVPSELVCFSVVMRGQLGVSKNPLDVVINFWINKWIPQGVGDNALPHIGVTGGGTYSLMSRVLAPLGLQLDLTGVVYAKLEAQKDDEGVEEIFPLNPYVLRNVFASADRTLALLFEGLSFTISGYSQRAGLFHLLGGSSSRDVTMGIAILLGLDKFKLEMAAPVIPPDASPSLYAASRYLFGEAFKQSYLAPSGNINLGASTYDTLRMPGRVSLQSLTWDLCKSELTTPWKTFLERKEEVSGDKTFLHWKDPEVKQFWLAKSSAPRTIRDLHGAFRVSPEVVVEKWKSLARKAVVAREAQGLDKPGDLVQHSALSNLRSLVT